MRKQLMRHAARLLPGVVAMLPVMLVLSFFDVSLLPGEDGGTAAAGQRQPPPQNVGQTEELLRSLDLTGELESTRGRPLRMRRLTVQPGGAQAVHSHAGRPAITFMLQGEMTYHQDGRPDVVVRAGEGMAEGRATTHWGENTGKTPAVWIAVDIPPGP